MLLCYITDRAQLPGDEREKRARLLAKITEASGSGVDYVQLRERDLPARELLELAREAVAASGTGTRLLVNSRVDVALAAGAGGVHLRSNDVAASEARAIWMRSPGGTRSIPVLGVSCHSVEEVRLAESHGADFAVFAPVFEKSGSPGAGLDRLRAACAAPLPPGNTEASEARSQFPVLALGGITLENAPACVAAGAAGIAAIRLFQENDIGDVVRQLRGDHVSGPRFSGAE